MVERLMPCCLLLFSRRSGYFIYNYNREEKGSGMKVVYLRVRLWFFERSVSIGS